MFNALPTINFKDSKNFFLIAGPCAIEGEQMAMDIAGKIVEITNELEIPYIFKGSFKKANRSRLDSFTGIGNEKALEIYSAALDQAEILDDKPSIGDCLSNIGTVSLNKSEYEKSLVYYNRALKIREELGDKWGIGVSLRDVSLCYLTKYDYDRCLDFSKRSLAIAEELDDKIVIGSNLGIIGFLYFSIGEKEIAIDYLEKALKINQKIDYKFNIGNWLWFMAYLYYDHKQDMDKALKYIQRGLIIIKEIGLKENELPAYVTQGIIYKHLGKDFDDDKIDEMISEREHISFEFHTLLYEFFKEKTYLLSAYKQIQEIADNMEEQLKVKFFDSTFVKRVMDEYAKLEGYSKP